MDESQQATPQVLRGRFRRYIQRPSRFRASLQASLDRIADLSGEVFVFGGLPRDLAIGSKPVAPRDVDVVVSGADLQAIEAAFGASVHRRTRFGGLVLIVEGRRLDVWDLHETWGFRAGCVSPPSFENLPRTTFLNVEAIAIEYRPRPGKARRVFEHGFFSALRGKQLEINLERNPYATLAVVRALVTASATGFSLGPSLRDYILSHTTERSVDDLIEAQLDHYGVVRRHRRTLVGWLRYLEQTSFGNDERVVLPTADGVQLSLWNTLNWDALMGDTAYLP